MPFCNYQCSECDHEFEEYAAHMRYLTPVMPCPKCGGDSSRIYAPPQLITSGTNTLQQKLADERDPDKRNIITARAMENDGFIKGRPELKEVLTMKYNKAKLKESHGLSGPVDAPSPLSKPLWSDTEKKKVTEKILKRSESWIRE